ncbi:hypothetical protein MVEN_00687700 [Mycena venus]|uniref:Glycoside hydrolase family 16 protein n=1 Tax=Mycena venus TaxID=2733690 RepID=A0A8H7D5K4_9AGAR|nr:hypothetical protein MVEN_00687700 [Mycena venus]
MSSLVLLGFFIFSATVSAIPSQGSNSTRADGGSGYNVSIVARTSTDGWSLTSQLQGQTFLDFFDFELTTNDNGGVAQYVDGVASGLAYTSGSQVVLAVDDTPTVSLRKAVRMHSKTQFNAVDNNLFIFDVAHIPAVCGTWPAIWLTGTNWPYDGEIDVVEAVNLYNRDEYSLHTGPGCTAPATMPNLQLVEAGATSCDATVDPGACGYSDLDSTSFGPGFNNAGGGVFALEFAVDGIKTWFWTAANVPTDIRNLSPTPSTWAASAARFNIPVSSCSPETYFNELLLVVNTNLAGSWPEGVWGTSNVGGQTTSCQTQTGVSTAAGYVTGHGSAFGAAAEWVINGFYIYNKVSGGGTGDCPPYGDQIGTYDGTSNYSEACADITNACLAADGTSIWSHAACVAAATCQGTASVIALNQCQNPAVLPAASIPNLSSTVYESIVGSCAPSCPITQQNYIDFVYGQMTAAGVTNFPASSADVVSQWWDPIVQWTATGATIPYQNFDDWLHYSNW